MPAESAALRLQPVMRYLHSQVRCRTVRLTKPVDNLCIEARRYRCSFSAYAMPLD